MPRSNNWFVLTGGPASGKTTLLAELQKKDYIVVPEAARAVIDNALAEGVSPEELRKDEHRFQDDVARMKIATEQALDESAITYFDRGMHDSIAYLRHYNYALENWLHEACQKASYAKVFLLEPLASYQKDYARTEDDTFFKRIHNLLKEAYEEAHLPVISVPELPVAERLNFILQHSDLQVPA